MIKNSKNVRKVSQQILAVVSLGLVILSTTGIIKGMVKSNKLSEEYYNYMESIKNSVEYQEEVSQREDEIYQKYKIGEYSYDEFNSKMKDLRSNKQIISGAFDSVNAEQIQTLENIKKENNKVMVGMCPSFVMFPAGIGATAGFAQNYINQKKNKCRYNQNIEDEIEL